MHRWGRYILLEKVFKSGVLSEKFDKRYIVADTDTGEIIDDAQGYGYTSEFKAERCYRFKNSPSGRLRMKLKKEEQRRKRQERLDTQRQEREKRRMRSKDNGNGN